MDQKCRDDWMQGRKQGKEVFNLKVFKVSVLRGEFFPHSALPYLTAGCSHFLLGTASTSGPWLCSPSPRISPSPGGVAYGTQTPQDPRKELTSSLTSAFLQCLKGHTIFTHPHSFNAVLSSFCICDHFDCFAVCNHLIYFLLPI